MAGPITQAVQNLLRRQQQRDQFETRFRFTEQKELSKRRLEATEKARQEDLRLQVFQNNPELLRGPLRQPIPPAGFNPQRNGQPGAPPIPRPGQKQEIQARLQGLQKRQQENFKEFAIDNEENARIFSQLPADVSAKLATQLRTGRTDSFARIKEQAGSFGSVAQQALSMKAGPRRNDFLIKDFETRQRLAESEGVQGPDAQRYLDIINATGNPDLQNSLLKNVVGTSRDIEKLITSKETQDKDQLARDDFALSDVFKSAAQLEGPQQDFLLREQRQAFIAEGNNRGVREIDRMLRVPAGPNRTLLMTSRGQQIEGKEVRKARLAPITLSPGQRRFGPGGEEIASVEAAPLKPETRTSLAKNLELAGIDPRSPEGKKIIKESITKPAVKIDLNRGLNFKIPLGFQLLNQNDPTKGITPIKGGPKDTVTGENAGKVQMLRVAKKAFKGVRALVFEKDKEGNVTDLNNFNLFNANLGVPFTDIRGVPFTDGDKLRAQMEFGIQAITRIETGAAMPDSELNNTRIRFVPKVTDSLEIAQLKLDMYEDFINGTIQLFDPSGRFNAARFDAELVKRGGEATPPATSQPVTNQPETNPPQGNIEVDF